MIFQNLHTHTIFSDGKNTPVEMIEAAIEKDFDVLGFSDHSPMPFPCGWAVPAERIPEYRETIRSLAEIYRDKIEIALGLEVDRFTLPLADKYDYTIGSTHYLYKDGVYLEIDHSRERQETAIHEHFSGDPLAYARHFPAINWLTSYSLYLDTLKGWCDENLGRGFMQNRGRAMALLQKEAELQEIVKLVGQDALSPADNLTLESAKMIREDFLQQNAFLENDQYSSFDRQARLLELILRYKDLCDAAIERGADIWKLYAIAARAAIGRAKTVPADTYQDAYAKIMTDMEQQIEEVAKEAEAE